jgi:tetratricopeptide (TPR) repeat protein
MPDRVLSGRWDFDTIRLVSAALAWSATSLGGQQLPLKVDYPGSSPIVCASIDPVEEPGEEERAQASSLGASAAQAVILGDLDRARELLARATRVDPSSVELAYRYARTLEDLGEAEAAVSEFCRALATGTGTEEVQDARARMNALIASERRTISDFAIESYRAGVSEAEGGFLDEAAEALSLAVAEAPTWPDAHYNLGVVFSRLGRSVEAAAEFRLYLDLIPTADDALTVSQRIGQLESLEATRNATATLGLGILLPGMGQFQSDRTQSGLTVLAAAGAALAAGYLTKEVTVQCLIEVPPGGDCEPGQVHSEETARPRMGLAIGAAAAITVIGAIEAYLTVRGQQSSPVASAGESGPRNVRLLPPTLAAWGSHLEITVLRVTF